MLSSLSITLSILFLVVLPSRFGILGPHMLNACLIDCLVIGELFSIFLSTISSISLVVSHTMFRKALYVAG